MMVEILEGETVTLVSGDFEVVFEGPMTITNKELNEFRFLIGDDDD